MGGRVYLEGGAVVVKAGKIINSRFISLPLICVNVGCLLGALGVKKTIIVFEGFF